MKLKCDPGELKELHGDWRGCDSWEGQALHDACVAAALLEAVDDYQRTWSGATQMTIITDRAAAILREKFGIDMPPMGEGM